MFLQWTRAAQFSKEKHLHEQSCVLTHTSSIQQRRWAAASLRDYIRDNDTRAAYSSIVGCSTIVHYYLMHGKTRIRPRWSNEVQCSTTTRGVYRDITSPYRYYSTTKRRVSSCVMYETVYQVYPLVRRYMRSISTRGYVVWSVSSADPCCQNLQRNYITRYPSFVDVYAVMPRTKSTLHGVISVIFCNTDHL